MTRLRQNFQSGTITDAPLTMGATTMNSAALANLMAVVAPDILAITLDPGAVNGAPEIVHVTAHTAAATSATILRAQEGTVARAHPVSSVWEHNITEDDFTYANLDGLPTLGVAVEDDSVAEGQADTLDFVGEGTDISFAAGTATVNISGKDTWGIAVPKLVTETVNNSTTLQNDDELLFAVTASTRWFFQILLSCSAAAPADMKFAITLPSGSCEWTVTSPHQSAGAVISQPVVQTAGTSYRVDAISTGTLQHVLITGRANIGATPGNVQLQWAQQAADVSDMRVFAGSALNAKKLG